MRTLALIPARAGSKGIPGKNLRKFDGVSLIDRALAIGRQSCTDAWVTTNIPDMTDEWVIRRPEDLSYDWTPMFDVVQHALQWLANVKSIVPDVVVLLQPTQPLRTQVHVLEALRILEDSGADSVVSVVEIPAHYSPDYAMMRRPRSYSPIKWELVPFLSRLDPEFKPPTYRQSSRRAYSRDGTVYAIKRQTIEAGSLYGSHCVPLIIPSHESVNLDSEEDWIRAEAMVANG